MLNLIIDDTVRVPDDIAALTGVRSFGRLLYRRQTLTQHIESAAREAGINPPVVLSGRSTLMTISEKLVQDGDAGRYLIFPANIVALTSRAQLVTLLRQLTLVSQNVALTVTQGSEWSGLALLDASLAKRYLASLSDTGCPGDFMSVHSGDLAHIENDLQFVDLRDQAKFLIFLTSNFDVRHFNAIVNENFTIVKRSSDITKLRKEFTYYSLLPPNVQMYFVQPFDFQEHDGYASYRMERLFLPDMAIQWVHGAIDRDEFDRLLQRIFHFIEVRPARKVGRDTAGAVLDQMYWHKVKERVEALKAMPQYAQLEPMIHQAVGGIDKLLARYRAAFAAARSRFPLAELVVGHGDLCFSNMLYSKSTQLLRFIDPRGALVEDDLYTDPYYDVAKLSHSIQGGYDFINGGRFGIEMDTDLSMHLQTDESDRQWARAAFHEVLRRHGFDPELVRLCEASLFISMLPLHIDIPKKVLAFVLNAASILDGITPSAKG